MALTPGTTLLHYEILEPLGAGAMGEVWHARDPRLGRDVAVKVLPPRFAEDPERLQRFEREARSIASLNHSCVAQIHDVGRTDDVCFLVLELVPGETLEDRLARGPLPVDEALALCARIADGLEAAHEAGIIHRDLKPANVRLTPDGQVKLLDFGLARPIRAEGPDGDGTDSVLATEAGRVLGTPTYMAPEQARGQPIDRRVDVWAFGCVLFECLAGRRAFRGDTLSDVLAAVLEHEPDWSALPPLPPPVEGLLRRCFVKDPRQRLRDVGEARLLFDGLAAGEVGATWPAGRTAGGAPSRAGRGRTGLVLAGVAVVVTVLALAWLRHAAGVTDLEGPLHVSVEGPAGARILHSGDMAGPPVVSPDGTRIAFAAVRDDGPRRLWIRPLDAPDARELPGTEGALWPFWSPDSRELGFFTDSALLRYDTTTDTVTLVTETGAARGGAFTGDGRILFTPGFRSGLSLVDVGGGEPVELTIPEPDVHTSHRWPSMVPGTDRFVFAAVTPIVGRSENDGLYLGRLDGAEPPRRLLSSHFGGQVVDGLLLHVKDRSLLATPFDVDTGALGERATTLVRGLAPDPSTWHGQFSTSPAGVLVLNRPSFGESDAAPPSLGWSLTGDRVSQWSYEGRPMTRYAEGTPMFSMALSPDGKMLAVDALSPDGFTDIWLYPVIGSSGDRTLADIEAALLEAPAPRRLTFLPGPEYLPVWSPDGAEVAFRWDGDDTRPRGIYRKRIGGGSETLVRDNHGEDDHANSWTRDGRFLIVTTDTILVSEHNDIIAVPLDGGPDLPLVTAPGAQYEGRVSPDGRWLAYADARERTSVFVTAFPPGWPQGAPDGRWLVSENGGHEPRWSPSGDELFYMTPTGTLIAVDVEAGGQTFAFGSPRALFQAPWSLGRPYDAVPGDPGAVHGFVFLDSDRAAEGPLSVVLGWQALLDDG